LGVYKGFRELRDMGFTDNLPALAPIQAAGCAPMSTSWKKGLDAAEPVKTPTTRIETLATGDPGRAYNILSGQVRTSRGVFEDVSDEEAFRAMHVLAKMEGISAEPAAALAFAGLFKLIRAGVIKPTDTVVVNCTGHTMPAEQFVLGDDWARNVVMPAREQVPQDGLLAALSNVAPNRFPRIAVVDDAPDVRRLIRRILQSQGNYTISEAADGREALELIRRELPDLVVLDLMMPEMDGFQVLDEMRAHQETAHIPVIVSTAKELTTREKNLLKGQIQSFLQKGDFLNDEFLEEVRSLLK
jgi:threonine synthase